MSRSFSVAAALLTLAVGRHAQSGISGKWQGETPNGAQIVLDLTAKGTELTGTLTRNKETSPITEGKVSKTKITFKATLNEKIEGFTGELEGDQLKVWLDRQGATNAIVLKRIKSS
jgi:hypothetical protein